LLTESRKKRCASLIHRFITKHFPKLKELFKLKCRRSPTHSCIWKILTGIDPKDLERVYREYFSKISEEFGQEQIELMLTHIETAPTTAEEQQAIEQLTAPMPEPLKHICMDGKTLRGSKSKTHNEKVVRMFNVLEKMRCLVVAHLALSSSKNSEITAFQALLQELDLQDILVSVDALQCQKKL
jgi:hypothetical protein